MSDRGVDLGAYFSAQVGSSVVAYVDRELGLRQPVLDFGAGPGFLVEEILRRGFDCTAVDFSERSLAILKNRLGDALPPRSIVAADSLPLALPSSSFALVFLIETIEHLLPDDRAATLTEIQRLLAPGGWVVATTPNGEDLSARSVVCPECGAAFHRVQHITSWNAGTLSALFADAGFVDVAARQVAFRRPPGRLLARLRQRLRRKTSDWPHLICFAKKPSGDDPSRSAACRNPATPQYQRAQLSVSDRDRKPRTRS